MLIIYSTLVGSKTPMSLLTLIIANSMIMAYLLFLKTMSPWGSLLLIMVYVSGVMVLFMYIVSLSPYFKGKVNNTKIKWYIAASIMVMTISSSGLNTCKEANKFLFSFEKTLSMLLITLAMLIIMATIVPTVAMAQHKGLKTSK